ncbi:unnamed protein product [Linum tenue]|uniref:CASP-like protein n=1 Tax=Linum tenue TaxID=586396 RepID=A0AAV0IX94_9ROSI|nr:unnamed protein product [Linum tenue]
MKQPESPAAAELAPGDGPSPPREASRAREVKRGIAILDLFSRFLAAAGTLGSAIAMGTTNETVTVAAFSQVFQFNTNYKDLPVFTSAKTSRIILVSLDTVMLSILTAGASSAAAMVYLAHKGNSNANWSAICQQFTNFCHRISGSLIGSFVAIILFIVIIIASSVALSRR